MTESSVPTSPNRALALDALRGLAILLMVFSGRIPFGVLPDWMYHAQVPPPGHVFNPNLPGITWVDLVFPFFLFAMGAAIPLALSRRVERGIPMVRIVLSVFLRGILLAVFAIYVMHVRPWLLSPDPDAIVWVFCLVGFLLLFPMIAQLPTGWNKWLRWGIRAGGWVGAGLLMIFVRLPDGSGFSLQRSDIIILVLSNVAVGGALIWLVTRNNWLLRLGFLGILVAIRLAAPVEGWVHSLWNISPAPWLFQVYFLQYLFLTIPGTIIGDLILQWMKSSHEPSPADHSWKPGHLITIAVLMVLINVVLVVGLKARWTTETTVASFALCLAGWYLVRRPSTASENFITRIFLWGAFWLVLGLFFEPYEGGIKKDHPTLSYYFVTGGLGIFALIALTIAIDVLKRKRPFALLIESGQNPLVAYAGVNSLVPPILGLLGLDTIIESITPTPWLGVLRGAFMTYLVALAASVCTKNKVFLKT